MNVKELITLLLEEPMTNEVNVGRFSIKGKSEPSMGDRIGVTYLDVEDNYDK